MPVETILFVLFFDLLSRKQLTHILRLHQKMANKAACAEDWTYSDLHSLVASAATLEQKNAAYDQYAQVYEKASEDMDWRGPCNTVARLSQKLVDYPVQDQKKIRILDVGCGTGFVGQRIREIDAFKELPIYLIGLDINESMLGKARKFHWYNELLCADFNTITFPDGLFDFVTASGLFWHGDCGPESLPAMLKFLKEGGYASISVRTKWFEEKNFSAWIETSECDLLEDETLPYVGNEVAARYLLLQKRSTPQSVGQ